MLRRIPRELRAIANSVKDLLAFIDQITSMSASRGARVTNILKTDIYRERSPDFMNENSRLPELSVTNTSEDFATFIVESHRKRCGGIEALAAE
jgi:hypothetical protein